ncbi:transglycosylase domain-containing protein [Isoptericola variabilis]|uniref:Peptidoglycan glycosyltransferase n=1 Tax=Isoptericola variabilis (strain 225) TaxID=743718 RepID=F6FWN7_ISOV2|nr:transglycosylase domain-containing protein [Isoptericola variabilis]AEG45678.1 Peptidoglycan glycosyltransferase [Isoptericola variabilis 225]TWH33771.1 membrane peptidoglycan carboxypeptidase [Isoptericola variabilis J7]
MPRRRRFWNYPRPNKGPVQRWLPSWRIVVGSMLGVGALGAGLVVAAYATTDIPDDLDEVKYQESIVYYADGTELGPISDEASMKREIIEYETLPEYVGGAVVASEDDTFWTNPGVDPKGIVRAAWNNLTGGSRQGASTLTQQYVERYYLDTTTTYAGKLKEAIIALKVARSQPKEQVLERYLNTIYWGRGAYGVQAAAQEYFGKNAADLTYSEAALLSGIIPSPSRWDPSLNLEQAERRWQRSIERMHAEGYITDDEYRNAQFPEFQERKEAANTQGGQTGYLIQEVKRELLNSGRFTEQDWTRGLRITTTIDKRLQDAAVQVAQSLPEDANPNIRASLVSIDPKTGAVVALYGGPDYVQQSLNTATQDVVQGGSTFKPFTLIGALEEGHTLDERYDGNSPAHFPGANNGEAWEPKNFGDRDYGRIDLVEATAQSVNSVYGALNIEIGPEKTVEVAHRLGIRESTEIEEVPANVLGTASVYPIDMARAYATIAAQGYRTTPHVVRSVETRAGEQIYQEQTASERVFEADVMAAATYAMTKVVEEGSGDDAQELARPVAGKTGTANDNMTAWFAGFVPQLATIVNVRQYETVDVEAGVMKGTAPIETFEPYREITGSTWPLRAWTDFMKIATEGMPVEEFPAYTPPRPSYSPSPTPSPSPTETEEQFVEVPNLVGMDIARATRELERLGLVLGAPVAQDSDQPRGTVLAQSSTGQVPVGSTITLTVSTGQTEQTVVPEVSGMTRTAAEQQLRNAGLRSSVREEENADVAPGTVISTDPGGGATVEPGSTVTLIVAKAPADSGGGGNGNGNGNGDGGDGDGGGGDGNGGGIFPFPSPSP